MYQVSSRIILVISYGCGWNELKTNIHDDLEELRVLSLIKDDTVFEESNLDLFMKKILQCIDGESLSVEPYTDKEDKLKYAILNFETREHRLMLEVGDTWRRVRKFLDILPGRVINCPICLEDVQYNRNQYIVGCPECNVIVCADCSIKQFIANHGIVVCCNCRYKVGTFIPERLIHQAAAIIRSQYNI